jgi:hypothetical protein
MRKTGIIDRFKVMADLHRDIQPKAETRPFIKNLIIQAGKLIAANAQVVAVYDLRDFSSFDEGYYTVHAGDLLKLASDTNQIPDFKSIIDTNYNTRLDTSSLEFALHRLNLDHVFLSLKNVNLIDKYRKKLSNLYMQIQYNYDSKQLVKVTLDAWLDLYVMPIVSPIE